MSKIKYKKIIILFLLANTISLAKNNKKEKSETESYIVVIENLTQKAALQLLRIAEQNSDTKNLNSLPELLLLSGGSPIFYKGNLIGSIGISGSGGPENDDLIAKSASFPELGITTSK